MCANECTSAYVCFGKLWLERGAEVKSTCTVTCEHQKHLSELRKVTYMEL